MAQVPKLPNVMPLLAELVDKGGPLPIMDSQGRNPVAYALLKAAFGDIIQLALEFPTPLSAGEIIYIPAWMPNLRGSKGEWFAPAAYHVTAV